MKKTVLLVSIPIIIIFCSSIGLIITKNQAIRNIKKENIDFEYYLDKTIYGTELASIINKAIDKNEKNKIAKDSNNYYIENETNSIKINIKMLITEKTYQMESLYNKGMTEFVKNFNLIKFKCTSIKYHKNTGFIKEITFEEIEEI